MVLYRRVVPLLTKLIISLSIVLPAWSQLTATVKPYSISGTADALGGGKVGIWKVDLCSSYPVSVDIARARLTQSFPTLKDLPNRLAEDLLLRKSSNSTWSVIARWGPPLLSAGGVAFATKGIVTGNTTSIWIGQGVSLLGMLFSRAGERAPQPNLYFSDLMPDRVSVPANDCGAGWLIASGIVRGAQAMTSEINVPGVSERIADIVTIDLAAERLDKILRSRGLTEGEIMAMVSDR